MITLTVPALQKLLAEERRKTKQAIAEMLRTTAGQPELANRALGVRIRVTSIPAPEPTLTFQEYRRMKWFRG